MTENNVVVLHEAVEAWTWLLVSEVEAEDDGDPRQLQIRSFDGEIWSGNVRGASMR